MKTNLCNECLGTQLTCATNYRVFCNWNCRKFAIAIACYVNYRFRIWLAIVDNLMINKELPVLVLMNNSEEL